MEEHPDAVDMCIGVEMIDSGSVECAGPSDDAMHFVAFREKKIGQITSILATDSGDQSFLHEWRSALKQRARGSKQLVFGGETMMRAGTAR